jgi:hypothetical protein
MADFISANVCFFVISEEASIYTLYSVLERLNQLFPFYLSKGSIAQVYMPLQGQEKIDKSPQRTRLQKK